MTRLFALAAIALAPFATPALAQQECDPESRVVLDRAQPNEEVSELDIGNRDRIIVSRFLNLRVDNCGPQQGTQMQVVQTQEQQQQSVMN
jgi:hypothetical protein